MGRPALEHPSCGSIAYRSRESLLESELFWHEKGAFTGATRAKPGLIGAAAGGTVFLDEIGEMPLATQAKLLSVVESKEVLPLGSVKAKHVDVRFVAATNRDLEAQVNVGAFRQDLYFRLNGLSIVIPPLRERVAEVASLARRFLDDAAARAGRPPPTLTNDALAVLGAHRWRGNIRELRNVMERIVVLHPDPVLQVEHFAFLGVSPQPAPKPDRCSGGRATVDSSATSSKPSKGRAFNRRSTAATATRRGRPRSSGCPGERSSRASRPMG